MKPFAFLKIRTSMGRLATHLRSHIRGLSLAGGVTLLGVLVELARPWPIKIVLDQIILGKPLEPLSSMFPGDGGRERLLAAACLAVLILAALSGMFAYISRVLLARIGQDVVMQVRRELHNKLIRLPLRFHDRHRRGDLIVRMTGDSAAMGSFLVEGLFSAAQHALMLTGVLAVALWVQLELALVAAITIPAAFWIIRHHGKRLREAARTQRRREGEIGIAAGASLASVPMVQAYGLEGLVARDFRRNSKRSQRAGVRAAKLEGAMGRWVEIAIAAGTAALLWLGSRRVLEGALTPGELIVLISYVRALYKPVRKLSSRTAKLTKAAASADRITEILDSPEQLPVPVEPQRLHECRGQLEFDNVHFAYHSEHPVLEGIHLSLAPGERVALVGENGSGKTTLLSLVPRLRDVTHGSIRIDGTDVRNLALEDLRRHVAFVFQDTVLFDGTILENVQMGLTGADESRVRMAIEASGLARIIDGLPAGENTQVGELGNALSGGQRQRVALARALLRGSSILLMDEPSRALDPEAADEFRDRLLPSLHGRTVLLITHDHSIHGAVDRVVELRHGRMQTFQPTVTIARFPAQGTAQS